MARQPDWLREALALPLFAAQSREDSLQDVDVVRALGRPARALVAATTPCTAAALAGVGDVVELHLVGPCPAALALARAKLRLLETREPAERQQVLGYGEHMPREQRREALTALFAELELEPDACGPAEVVARQGLDYAGRMERAWLALRHELSRRGVELTDFLLLRDLAEQARRTASSTLMGQEIDASLKAVLGPRHAAALSGVDKDHPWARGVAKGLGRALRDVFERVPVAANPFLQRLLTGAGSGAPWHQAPRPERLPRVEWTQAALVDALGEDGPGFDTIHLGDSLDRLAVDAVAPALDAAVARLLPGGALVLHCLTVGPLPEVEGLSWDADYAERLGQESRSPFTRTVAVGRKPS